MACLIGPQWLVLGREYHPEVGDAASNLAIVMASLGNTKEAALLVEKAKVAWEAGYGEDTMHSRLGLLKARVDIHLSEVMEPVPA